MAESLTFPQEEAAKLERRLPPRVTTTASSTAPELTMTRPFVTLTFATSLDSALSLAPGRPTALSGPQSKAMTHFLRSRHDAILVGVGTAVADDPGLRCRLDSAQGLEHQPRPIVIDPRARWDISETSKVLELARADLGLAPFIITTSVPPAQKRALVEAHGGKYIVLPSDAPSSALGPPLKWESILSALLAEGLRSVMIEGGGHIINGLLSDPQNSALVDSVIVTIAPVWLGQGGVVVSPDRAVDQSGEPRAAVRLTNTSWHPLGDDVVLCGEIPR